MTVRQVVRMNSAQTVLIDALEGDTFLIRLVTSIKNLRIKNVSPGQLYVFVLTQDSTGGRKVQWGDQVVNAIPANQPPNSVTIQSCIGTTGGFLRANMPGVWS